MKKFLEKNKKIIISICIIITVTISTIFVILIFNHKKEENQINQINSNNYSLQYDSTWEIDKQDEKEINLLHKKSKSELNIKIHELQDENQYRTLDEIVDSLLYNIHQQNKEYKLIYKEKTKITKQNEDGYKLLFEAKDKQVAIYLYKQGSQLIVITYEAINEDFDILINSVNNIIYNLNINESKFDVKTSINLETSEIDYTEQTGIENLLNGTKKEEIASSNYSVNYTIPSNFKVINDDTKYKYYSLENIPLGTSLSLNTSIINKNIYEYLDKEDTPNVYSQYNLNSYNEEKEKINKISDKPLTYIYKNNYLTNNEITENIVIMFELNKNHIFVVKIASQGVGIPEKLVKMININEYKNIATNN